MQALEYSFAWDSYKAYIKMLTEVKLNEENEEEEPMQERVEFTVQILKVKDEEKYIVDFTRTRGDLLAFNKIYKDAKEYFGGLVNVTK